MKESDSVNRKEKVTELKAQLKAAYTEEENFWSQKTRINWLKVGDKNTKYFHAHVKGRRTNNRIRKLQKENGSWTENEEELVSEISDFFRELFASGGRADMSEILEGVPHSIAQEMNTKLTKPVEEDEIKAALFSMQPNKAPGQDGMSPHSFKGYGALSRMMSSLLSNPFLALVLCLNLSITLSFLSSPKS